MPISIPTLPLPPPPPPPPPPSPQRVWDYDYASKDDLLGMVEIPLSSLAHQKKVQGWFKLLTEKGEPAGEVQLVLHYRFSR